MESDSGNLRSNVLGISKHLKTKRRILPSEYAAHLYPDLVAKYALHYCDTASQIDLATKRIEKIFKHKHKWSFGEHGAKKKSRQNHGSIYKNTSNAVDLCGMAPLTGSEDEQQNQKER